jgi:hypothetical protein
LVAVFTSRGRLFHSRTSNFIIWVIAVLNWGVDMSSSSRARKRNLHKRWPRFNAGQFVLPIPAHARALIGLHNVREWCVSKRHHCDYNDCYYFNLIIWHWNFGFYTRFFILFQLTVDGYYPLRTREGLLKSLYSRSQLNLQYVKKI